MQNGSCIIIMAYATPYIIQMAEIMTIFILKVQGHIFFIFDTARLIHGVVTVKKFIWRLLNLAILTVKAKSA